ncbi:MAG TPA: hypothetical protein PK867_23935 [Pirellulales bacterium]|nr:hypothetical protein [Pirellulales bacterium]
MKSEDWGIAIGIIVAIGSVVGPWMWSVNSKLARIAHHAGILRQMAKVLLRHTERLDEHQRRLDAGEKRIEGVFQSRRDGRV